MNKTGQLSIIVFSKDRPLQMQGYLESLLYFSEIDPQNITVLYKDCEEINYTKLINDFEKVNWIKESSFFQNLTTTINLSSKYIMFGCDDVIFKGVIDFDYALNVLNSNENVFGFSLRLGKNIKPFPKQVIYKDLHIEWGWKHSNLNSWNYPWELDSTIYRKDDVENIISKLNAQKISNPNFFEGEIASNPHHYIKKDCLASFNLSKSIVITVNRVQETFKNEFDNTLATDVISLNNVYMNGGKIDFLKISEMQNKHIHVGADFFKISGSKGYNVPLISRLKLFLIKVYNLLKRRFE
jgi:hypothetical protein